MAINQGDVYWIQGQKTHDSELGFYRHPYVVVQDNLFNHSRIHTVVVCALTTKMQYANAYGNVLLEQGEANLPKPSVVVVSKISSVEKTQLGEYIGSLTDERINQVLAGIRFQQSSFRTR